MRVLAATLLSLALTGPCFAQGAAPQRPVDHGPFTPEANRAYQGGGVVLQGAPGAPSPPPGAARDLPPGPPSAPPR